MQRVLARVDAYIARYDRDSVSTSSSSFAHSSHLPQYEKKADPAIKTITLSSSITKDNWKDNQEMLAEVDVFISKLQERKLAKHLKYK